MLNSTLNPILQTAITDVYDRLNTFVEDALFTEKLSFVFGQNAATITPKQFLNFVQHLPKIEIQKASNLAGTLGAFSDKTNTIYLSDSLLNSSQSNQLTAVLLEEIGHYLDSRLNKADTKGDEGELFSAVVRGINLSPTELTRIQNENDQKQIILDGKLLTVEQATEVTLPLTAVSFPREVIPFAAGKIDFWAKLSGFSGPIFWGGGEAHFFAVSDGNNYFQVGFNGNDGRGNGGLTGLLGSSGYHGNSTGTGSWADGWTYENVLGTGSVDQWHHYVFQWDKNGIPGLGDKRQAIFVDGNLNSHSWTQDGQVVPLTGGSLNLITASTGDPTLPRPLGEIAIDEFKIYDGNNNLILWNTLGSIDEIQNSSVGLNGIFNNVADVHFIPGVSGNAVMAKQVMAKGIEPDKEYNLTTTNLTDNFYTQNGNDTINSTFANLQQKDVLNASGGIDTLIITLGKTTDSIAINASDTINQANIPGTTIANFERFDLSGFLGTTNFVGTASNDWIKSGAGNDNLAGGDGNDYLDGGLGADQMGGGLGDDTYVIDNAGDVIFEALNSGTDTVIAPFTWTLKVNLENLTLTGSTNLNGTGNELSNTLVGNAGNNILDGGLGRDRLIGGPGNDTYIVDDIGDAITENLNEGKDLVQATVNTTLTNNVEDLSLLGTTNINGTGNDLGNVLTGNSGNNLLKGLNGDDTLLGAAGNDTLVGGAGNDALTGGDGADQLLFGSGVAFTTSGFGIDNITDLVKGTDKIVLSKVSFNKLTSVIGNLQTVDFASINTTVNELSLVGSSSAKIVYNRATGNLFYNPDGAVSGLTNGGQFAILNGLPNLAATDFQVIA